MKRLLRSWLSNSPLVLHQALYWAERVNRPGRQRNVAMFHAGRSGSTVLCKMLGQSDKVYWPGEVLTGLRSEYMRNLRSERRAEVALRLSMYRRRIPVFGFDTQPINLLDYFPGKTPADYVAFLKACGFTHFIILERRNLLKRFLSAQLALQFGRWHSRHHAEAPPKITLGFEHVGFREGFQDVVTRQRDYYRHVREAVGDAPSLDLVYEDDILQSPYKAYEKCWRSNSVTQYVRMT